MHERHSPKYLLLSYSTTTLSCLRRLKHPSQEEEGCDAAGYVCGIADDPSFLRRLLEGRSSAMAIQIECPVGYYYPYCIGYHRKMDD